MIGIVTMLKCSVCFQEKSLSDFHESSNNRGKQYMCIPCYSAYFKNWRELRKNSPQTEFPQAKTCRDCHKEKPISQFGKRSQNKDKKNDYCIPCWRVRTKSSLRKHYELKRSKI